MLICTIYYIFVSNYILRCWTDHCSSFWFPSSLNEKVPVSLSFFPLSTFFSLPCCWPYYAWTSLCFFNCYDSSVWKVLSHEILTNCLCFTPFISPPGTFFFFFFNDWPAAHGSSQARDQTHASAVNRDAAVRFRFITHCTTAGTPPSGALTVDVKPFFLAFHLPQIFDFPSVYFWGLHSRWILLA